MEPMVAWFEDLPLHSVSMAGGKGASLGDMARAGLPVPPGFVVCAAAFRSFLAANGGRDVIRRAIEHLNVNDESQLDRAEKTIRSFLLDQRLPSALNADVQAAYRRLGRNAVVAVRSSAISEDSQGASFAGQQETFLNVRDIEAVLHYVRECWASFFTARALFYRAQKGSLADTSMAVVVQKMVNPDRSGVLFTRDPVQNRLDQMVIEAAYGLGEAVVSGLITPDQYIVDRDDGSLVREHVSIKSMAVVRAENGGTEQVPLSEEQARARVLSERDLERLRKIGLDLERYFGKPQDVEWCIEGEALYLLQSRPITTL
jgi:pyruvate,water dikinase